MREVLSAAQRGHDLVVLDLPRRRDAVVAEAVTRCDRVLLVVTPTVAGVAAAGRLAAAVAAHGPAAASWLRGGAVPPGRGRPRRSGCRWWPRMADQRGLAEHVDLGLGPVRARRGPLGRAAAERARPG